MIDERLAVATLSKPEWSALFRFLGRLWLRDLDEVTCAQLRGPLADSWKALGGALPTESLDELNADFCQLLSHPKTYVAPFQSVWVSGQLDGPPAQSMRRFLVDSGYRAVVEFDEVSDHFGLQLDLLGWMYSQAHGDDKSVVAPIAELVDAVADRFVVEHLGWADGMLERFESSATTDFYCRLVTVTRRSLEVAFG